MTSFTTEEINSNHRGSARSNLMQPKQLENVDLETTSASSQNCVKPSIDDFPNDYMTEARRCCYSFSTGHLYVWSTGLSMRRLLRSLAGTDHEQASHGL